MHNSYDSKNIYVTDINPVSKYYAIDFVLDDKWCGNRISKNTVPFDKSEDELKIGQEIKADSIIVDRVICNRIKALKDTLSANQPNTIESLNERFNNLINLSLISLDVRKKYIENNLVDKYFGFFLDRKIQEKTFGYTYSNKKSLYLNKSVFDTFILEDVCLYKTSLLKILNEVEETKNNKISKVELNNICEQVETAFNFIEVKEREDWYDVLLDKTSKLEQIKNLINIINNTQTSAIERMTKEHEHEHIYLSPAEINAKSKFRYPKDATRIVKARSVIQYAGLRVSKAGKQLRRDIDKYILGKF